jgi:hypothetical protein
MPDKIMKNHSCARVNSTTHNRTVEDLSWPSPSGVVASTVLIYVSKPPRPTDVFSRDVTEYRQGYNGFDSRMSVGQKTQF